MKASLWILVFSLLLGACAPANSLTAAPTEPATTAVTSPPTAAVETAVSVPPATPVPAVTSPYDPPPVQEAHSAKTLQELGLSTTTLADPSGGFTFEYPSGWIVQAPSEEEKQNATMYSITLRSGEVTRGPKQQEGLPEGLTAVDIAVARREAPKTLAQAVEERRSAASESQTGQPLETIVDDDWVLPGGLPAHRFVYNLGPAVVGTPGPDRFAEEVVTMVRGQMVLVAGQGDLQLVEAIAATLREVP